MRSLLLGPLLVAPALAQTINTTVLTNLAGALTQAGLTSLASIAAQIANTTAGNALLVTLTNSTSNLTLLAPDNAAFAKVPKNVSSNADLLAAILSYHVVSGPFQNTSFFFDSPNNTILSTFLNSTDDVQLNGADQVLVATVKNNKTITFLNQPSSVTVTNTTTFGNFDILVLDGVLTPPAPIATVLNSSGLDLFNSAVASAGLTNAINNASGITVFAPNDAAFTAALKALGAQATNITLITDVLLNHIINGSALYSTQFSGKTATSGGGESLTFNITANATRVSSGSSGNFTAKILTADILTSNGVIHIIDTVLANTDNNPSAASSAFTSATSAASGSTSSSSGPVGATPSGTPGSPAWAPAVSMRALLAVVFAAVLGACSL